MKGAGFYAAANRYGIDWLIIKGVCDWGYGKNDSYQLLAAKNAVKLVKTLLAEPGTLAGLKHFASREDTEKISKLDQITLRLAFNESSQKIREAYDALYKTGDKLASLVSNVTIEGNQRCLPAATQPLVELAVANNTVAMEKWLNAHEDAATKYLHVSINPKLYRDTYSNEIRQLFEIEGEHKKLLDKNYFSLKKVYEELCAADLPK